MKTTLHAIVMAVLLLGGATLLIAPVHADEIDDQVAELQKLAKDGDDGKVLAKLTELQDSVDARVVKAVAKLTKNKNVRIAAGAVKSLAARKDKSFFKAVKSKIGDKKLGKKKPDLYVAYLKAAGEYREPKFLDGLADVVKKYLPTNARFSMAAIRSYGTVREKDVVDQLITWLEQCDSAGGGSGSGGGGSGKSMSQETRDNYAKGKSACIDTLAELTGQDIGDAKTWKDWWKKRKKKFTFPDPDAPEVDPATLSKWTDIAYGYTVNKPEAAGWIFEKPDEAVIRMRLVNKDEDGYVNCRAEFLIHNLTRENPKTVKGLAEWYVGDYKENRFSVLSKDPVLEEKKLNGHDWFVVAAKGDSGGNFKGWATAEMRVYITKLDHIALRIEATTRLGSEPEVMKALWDAIEGMTWE